MSKHYDYPRHILEDGTRFITARIISWDDDSHHPAIELFKGMYTPELEPWYEITGRFIIPPEVTPILAERLLELGRIIDKEYK